MRTHEFTFKKTKRVKTVTEHPAISVDLTRDEARELAGIMEEGSYTGHEVEAGSDPVGEAMFKLHLALKRFVDRG